MKLNSRMPSEYILKAVVSGRVALRFVDDLVFEIQLVALDEERQMGMCVRCFVRSS